MTLEIGPMPWETPFLLLAFALHRPLGLALGVALGDRLALVVAGLAPGDRQLHLRPPVLEVHAERDERDALLLGCPCELDDLLVVQQQLARPHRIEVAAGE